MMGDTIGNVTNIELTVSDYVDGDGDASMHVHATWTDSFGQPVEDDRVIRLGDLWDGEFPVEVRRTMLTTLLTEAFYYQVGIKEP